MTKFPCEVVNVEFFWKVVDCGAVFSPSAWDGSKLGAKGLGWLIVKCMVD